jgi:NAD(P)-dependent dehydrogenase (short-subunit alcohol dehydrogenase family)
VTTSETAPGSTPARPLEGQVALVTGGSRGIGQAIAFAIAAEGAHVVAVARKDEQGCRETVRRVVEAGGAAAYVMADASRSQDVDRMIAETLDRFGHLDILVNTAGMQPRGSFLDTSEENWDEAMATNLKSTFLCSQRAARAMIARGEPGAIVNIASHAGLRYIRGMSPQYHVSKAAIIHLTRCMAVELAPHAIRVNAIAPGIVETDVTRPVLADPARREQLERQIPLGRVGTPADIAETAVFLSSGRAAWMTGETLVVNGGQSLW